MPVQRSPPRTRPGSPAPEAAAPEGAAPPVPQHQGPVQLQLLQARIADLERQNTALFGELGEVQHQNDRLHDELRQARRLALDAAAQIPPFVGPADDLAPEDDDDNAGVDGDDDEDADAEDDPDMAAPAPAEPANPQAASGSQITSIPEYDGKTDIEIWLRSIERARTQFNWAHATTAAVAKSRLTGAAAYWLEARERNGDALDTWFGDDGLRKALKDRFLTTLTQLDATEAVMNLQQRPSETVREFYDRVMFRVHKKNRNWEPAADAAQDVRDAYRRAVDADMFAFFCAGLDYAIRQTALSGGDAPQDHQQLLDRAVAIENARAKARNIQALDASVAAAEVIAADKKGEPEKLVKSDDVVDRLTNEVAALRVQLEKKGNPQDEGCFHCGSKEHFVRQCPSKRTQARARGRGQVRRQFRPQRRRPDNRYRFANPNPMALMGPYAYTPTPPMAWGAAAHQAPRAQGQRYAYSIDDDFTATENY